jgi:hypothetical protein
MPGRSGEYQTALSTSARTEVRRTQSQVHLTKE